MCYSHSHCLEMREFYINTLLERNIIYMHVNVYIRYFMNNCSIILKHASLQANVL